MHEEPVEILVGMAERGEIDPWNIDIVEITDRFLSELEKLKELDLRISGRTLFFAATLLRMKSEYLEEADLESEEELLEDIDEFTDEFGLEGEYSFDDVAGPIERLEREIQRRIRRKDKRKRPVTLYELIKELKTAEKMERRRSRRNKISDMVFIEADDILDVAHEEDYDDDTALVYAGFERLQNASDAVTLAYLSQEMGRDARHVYLPLLYLMLEGKLMLTQDEFFGEIHVKEWRADAFDE